MNAGQGRCAEDPDDQSRGDQYDAEVLKFYEDEARRLYSFIRRLTRDGHLAEDVLQETFMIVRRRWPSVRQGTNPTGYAFKVARHLCGDLADRSRRRREDLTDFSTSPGDVEPAALVTPESLTEREELAARVRAAVKRLPRRQQEALGLYYFAHYSVKEVAGIMGVVEPTVRSLLMQGRNTLRGTLGDESGGGAA